MIHVAAFSGGKDSTALLLWLREQAISFTAVFCDTGWEHPFTYAYIDDIDRTLLGGALVILKPDQWVQANHTEQYADMRDLVARKGRVPSIHARFCTEYLKVRPIIAWLASLDDEVTLYQGIRADESAARATLLRRQWSDDYDCWIERPLLTWTADECFTLLKRHGVAANPLYRLGSKRVGCFPCVMTRHAELRRLTKTLPEVWDRIAELERLAGRSYFPPGFIPDRYCSNRQTRLVEVEAPEPNESQPTLIDVTPTTRMVERVAVWPSIADVRAYLDTEATLDGDDDGPACLSVYNLCE